MIERISGKGSRMRVRRQNEGGRKKISPTSEQATQPCQTARKKKPLLFYLQCAVSMATREVRQAGPALHPALGIRISQRFSDVRKVGQSGSLPANAALLPFGEVWAHRGRRGGAAESHGNTVGTVVCGDGAGRKGTGTDGKCMLVAGCGGCSDQIPSVTQKTLWSFQITNSHISNFKFLHFVQQTFAYIFFFSDLSVNFPELHFSLFTLFYSFLLALFAVIHQRPCLWYLTWLKTSF